MGLTIMTNMTSAKAIEQVLSEVKDPRTNLKRALPTSVIIVSLLYILVNVAYVRYNRCLFLINHLIFLADAYRSGQCPTHPEYGGSVFRANFWTALGQQRSCATHSACFHGAVQPRKYYRRHIHSCARYIGQHSVQTQLTRASSQARACQGGDPAVCALLRLRLRFVLAQAL